jgi:cytochrome c2/flagellar biosynthesis chaperone FliJ
MAARDDHYRNQRTLNIVFSVSCIAMLVTTIWMFWADYVREYKVWQRKGFDVEVALLEERIKAFDEKAKADVKAAEDRVRDEFRRLNPDLLKELDETRLRAEGTTFMTKARKMLTVAADGRIRQAEVMLAQLKPSLVRESDRLSAEKALEGSLISFRDIMLVQGVDAESLGVMRQRITDQHKLVESLELSVQDKKREQDRLQRSIEEGRARVTDAVNQLGAILSDRDRQSRQIAQKEFSGWTAFRSWPIVDAFASPYRIQQHIPDGLTIDYNFKYVPRVDRCATCHVFIDRSGFTKEDLADLAGRRSPEGMRFDPTTTQAMPLTTAEINVYANHPRLDLFVGSNSPHSAEKFGCTICHAGQGGSTTFNFAYHFPDDGVRYNPKVKSSKGKDGKEKLDSIDLNPTLEPYQADKDGHVTGKRARWEKEHHWLHDLHPNFLWDSPMLPQRFVESSCLKCHHQVTDLIGTDGREHAPKLLQGYRLLRDNGCFACHEISGWKGGQQVGPDMRLEPSPAPDEVSAQERAKMYADPTDTPGQLRKNGPGLRRIAEKSSVEWMQKWIRSPRSFRPETKMPHFFGQHNNNPHQLSDYQPGLVDDNGKVVDRQSQLPDSMKGFPDAEIRAMAFYLHRSSESYLALLKQVTEMNPSAWAAEQQKMESFRQIAQAREEGIQKAPRREEQIRNDDVPLAELLNVPADQRHRLTKDQLRLVLDYYADVARMQQSSTAFSARKWPPEDLPANYKGDPKKGGMYFELKGCLACHSHETVRDKYTPKKMNEDDPNFKLYGDLHKAHFGPPLIGLGEKLGYDKGNPEKAQKAEKWLYYWLTNPADYHPRTNMPNPRLEPQERADIVAWLLQDEGNRPAAQKPAHAKDNLNRNVYPPALWWDSVQVSEGDVDGLLKTYLQKALPTSRDVNAALKEGIEDVSYMRSDADERLFQFRPPDGTLAATMDLAQRKLFYLGKKSITKYGCYACHDIPGFEGAKPIGTPLNDWGKKDPERLAFDNITKYVGEHKHRYDPFFKHALEGHPGRRDGFLYQKLAEPRSYDYQKYADRPWDDRLKMPQFRFSHTYRKPGETDAAYQARAEKEEHDAREAVMTFVLGLVAEPINAKFVYQPREDRKYEIRGLQLLEKYNCVGCHITKPGVYETAYTPALEAQLKEGIDMHGDGPISRIPYFPESNAWKATRSNPEGKFLLKGLINNIDAEGITVEPWEAAPFRWKGEDVYDPAGRLIAQKDGWTSYPVGSGRNITLPPNTKVLAHPYGGYYTDIHYAMLEVHDKELRGVNKKDNRRSGSPPPLMREGQKVQPKWLHEFLRSPMGIRPAVYAYLRMPRFQMSDDEAEALVNYFIAVDRIGNPGMNLEYFNRRVPQQDPKLQEKLRREYMDRLTKVAGFSQQEAANLRQNDYFSAGWKILSDKEYCLKCHNIGGYVAEKSETNGPSLHMVPDRIRPEYFERWVSYPKRILPYTLMPAQPIFLGREDPQAADFQKAQKGTILPTLLGQDNFYNYLRKHYALTPRERLWAVQNALLSWGALVQPPPLAEKAGPRPDPYTGGDTK